MRFVHLREHEQRRTVVLHESSSGLQVPRLWISATARRAFSAITSPPALGMEEGEVPLYMVVTPDYKRLDALLLRQRQVRQVPLSSYETKQNRRKLLKAYSDKAELAFYAPPARGDRAGDFHHATTGLLLVGSALIPEKTTRDTAGVSVVALKKNAKIARVTLAEGLELNDAPRYRVRTLPAAGAILKDDDRAEQLTL